MHRRRFPWLTREDLAILAELENTDPALAREFERLLDRQRRSEARCAAHETLGVDPGDVADRRHANARRGAGGGRKRTTYNPDA